MPIQNVHNIDVKSKYVLLRTDFNVQIVDGKITDTFRIDASMPTIKYLIDNGARVVICSHLGRPKGKFNPELSLRPIAEYMNVPFIDDCLKKDFLMDMPLTEDISTQISMPALCVHYGAMKIQM